VFDDEDDEDDDDDDDEDGLGDEVEEGVSLLDTVGGCLVGVSFKLMTSRCLLDFEEEVGGSFGPSFVQFGLFFEFVVGPFCRIWSHPYPYHHHHLFYVPFVGNVVGLCQMHFWPILRHL